MPNFTKNENQLKSRLDKWLYFIKYSEDMVKIPEIFKDKFLKMYLKKLKLQNTLKPIVEIMKLA